ncbi:GNAT family N-acetyltransferase [Consotaella salsifontis]|uniref:N-acetylglutamate synthase, GNAT family n=1 Tax=Consotaella salsifontis TaxID=1365950 RepID=A0A1T4T4J5_9HYPH|nr:GNAT family N-acetyltransferase [Consotaella salsifontis]SKA35424.1 N-acetylglutamate synthase, GNAT family [Consotaella salsifontis]
MNAPLKIDPDRVFSIRPASPADGPMLSAMIRALAAQHGDVARGSAQTLLIDAFGFEPWIRILVAEAAGALIGYAILLPTYAAHFGERGMNLHHLFVADGWRGKGVGKELVRAGTALAQAQGCAFFTTGSHADNTPAHAFYEAIGFSVDNRPTVHFSQRLTA